ncbi:RagB/SusD family nutrient uptake outer membrane protein [Olivibacter sp. XZL3]|uniref:RagB/SusD family nutrient uptake outer membrane protein n=1 Tax=Olivibacter sp. XZL3 TaxID=1735116 RepID=UPI00106554D2|nr:RagB/SusD family nutrient uptake outer membrane protein [Olivibacter sp. XZL3]
MKRILTLLIYILSLSSCSRDKWLDIQPKGVVIPNKTQDYRLLLDQVDISGAGSGTRISTGFGASHYNSFMMDDDFVIKDELIDYYSSTNVNRYTWNDNIFLSNEEDPDWKNLYAQIYVCNIVIEEVMDAEGDIREKERLLSEAKAQRAYAYFILVNLYARHYNEQTAAATPAVPLRLTSDIEGVNLTRASVKEVYDQIIEDATGALDHLPSVPESNNYLHRPTASGLSALLARIYLYRADYDRARSYAEQSLSLKNSLINYNALEDRFGYGILYYPQYFEPQNTEILWFKEGWPYALIVASDELYDLFEGDDLRPLKYAPISFLYGLPYDGYTLGAPLLTNEFPVGPSTPEMYLTRAECHARNGNIAAAMQDVNTLLEARIKTGSFTPRIASTPEEALRIVKEERRKELAGGGLRYFDLKRYNEFDNANITLTKTLGGTTYTLPAGSKNWAVPIAQKYILASPELGENDRD